MIQLSAVSGCCCRWQIGEGPATNIKAGKGKSKSKRQKMIHRVPACLPTKESQGPAQQQQREECWRAAVHGMHKHNDSSAGQTLPCFPCTHHACSFFLTHTPPVPLHSNSQYSYSLKLFVFIIFVPKLTNRVSSFLNLFDCINLFIFPNFFNHFILAKHLFRYIIFAMILHPIQTSLQCFQYTNMAC